MFKDELRYETLFGERKTEIVEEAGRARPQGEGRVLRERRTNIGIGKRRRAPVKRKNKEVAREKEPIHTGDEGEDNVNKEANQEDNFGDAGSVEYFSEWTQSDTEELWWNKGHFG